MSSYHGDGNSYRGVVCRESQTPTIVYRSDDGVVTLLEQRIHELESINADLVEALEYAKGLLEEYEEQATGECFNSTMINAALAKTRGEEPPR